MLLPNDRATLEIWFSFDWKQDFPLLVISVFLSDLLQWLAKVFTTTCTLNIRRIKDFEMSLPV